MRFPGTSTKARLRSANRAATATARTSNSCRSSPASSAGGGHLTLTTSDLPSPVRWGAGSATNTPSRFAGPIIERSIGAEMRPVGGRPTTSMRSRWHKICGGERGSTDRPPMQIRLFPVRDPMLPITPRRLDQSYARRPTRSDENDRGVVSLSQRISGPSRRGRSQFGWAS